MEGLDLKSAPTSLTEGLRLMLTSHSLRAPQPPPGKQDARYSNMSR
jgi:hypothetical protein